MHQESFPLRNCFITFGDILFAVVDQGPMSTYFVLCCFSKSGTSCWKERERMQSTPPKMMCWNCMNILVKRQQCLRLRSGTFMFCGPQVSIIMNCKWNIGNLRLLRTLRFIFAESVYLVLRRSSAWSTMQDRTYQMAIWASEMSLPTSIFFIICIITGPWALSVWYADNGLDGAQEHWFHEGPDAQVV